MDEIQTALEIPAGTMSAWQDIVDTIAELANVPVSLIMRLREPYIEVALASATEGNPYHPGDHEHFDGSGLYCETVIKTRAQLRVPDALADSVWDHNPDIRLGMVSYLGLPITLPDGQPFGTLCILDSQPNGYSRTIERLMRGFRDLIEANLETLYVNQALGEANRRLSDYLAEIQTLRGFVHICSYCRSIKDEEGNWHPIEHYLVKHPQVTFSHGICPECLRRNFPDMARQIDAAKAD